MSGSGGRAPRVFTAVLVLLTLSAVEGISFFAGTRLESRGIFYKPVVAGDYEDYLRTRDPVLGWPDPGNFGKDGRHDISGSRIIPAFPDPDSGRASVSLYGDSFTWSAEVDPAHAWSNVLSELLGSRVANYGEGGYGTDQAYLRFLHNRMDRAPVVILNHFAMNIARNVNQFRDLITPGPGKTFKPRFVVHAGSGLEQIPLPAFAPDEYPRVVKNPERYLTHEYFLPGGSFGVRRLRFPFTLSLIRVFGNSRVRSSLSGRPWYEPFYTPGHESGGLEVTAAILEAFVHQARLRGKTPVVALLPGGDDLRMRVKKGAWTYQPLQDLLAENGIEVLNVGAGILDFLDGRDPCTLFDDCNAHYNEEGYAVVARVVFEYLQSHDLAASE